MERVVVVGAGLAGGRTVEALRARGYTGPLTLVGAEPHEPYDRPPLSKELLAGETDRSSLGVALADLDVEVLLGCRATGLRDGVVDTELRSLDFDGLVVATGSRPLTLPGAESAFVLRTVDDALALRARLLGGGRLVVVGAGWIGAEVTTVARAAGCEVTVVEALDAPLAGPLSPEVGRLTAPWYAEAGADLRTGVSVAAVEPDGVELSDGSRVPADAVLVAVGVRPDVEWLAGSGLAVERGVVVDEHLRASDPRVFAAGDAAAWWSRRYGARLSVEHWDNALHAPDVVAANLLGGDEVHDPVPYFWSTQFGRRVQMVGWRAGGERLVWRGEPGGDAWGAAWLRDGRLTAFASVNRPRDTIQARKLIEHDRPVDVDRIADLGVAVRDAAA